jgi:lipopolysaccharide export system permease protein
LRLLDRYLLNSFLLPFSYLLLGLLAIWFIADLANFLNDFLEARVSILQIFELYWGQLPFVVVQMLPICALLALLYSMIRLSQANELLAMSSAGVSFLRIVAPFLLSGVALALVSLALNYELAPQAEGAKGRLVAELTKSREGDGRLKLERFDYAVGHLYPNTRDGRLWYVQKISRRGGEPLRGVQVTQQDLQGNIVAKYAAPAASYDEKTKTWRLVSPRIVQFDAEGNLLAERYPEEEVITGWSETPARIAAATLQAQHLSVDELRTYVTENSDGPAAQLAPFRTHLYYRFALPCACFLLVMVAAPLSMGYARRRVIAGVAGAIVIFFVLMFLSNFFLALGQGNRLDPFWAAWAPSLLLFGAGLILLRRRSLNHERILTSGAGLRHFFGL